MQPVPKRHVTSSLAVPDALVQRTGGGSLVRRTAAQPPHGWQDTRNSAGVLGAVGQCLPEVLLLPPWGQGHGRMGTVVRACAARQRARRGARVQHGWAGWAGVGTVSRGRRRGLLTAAESGMNVQGILNRLLRSGRDGPARGRHAMQTTAGGLAQGGGLAGVHRAAWAHAWIQRCGANGDSLTHSHAHTHAHTHTHTTRRDERECLGPPSTAALGGWAITACALRRRQRRKGGKNGGSLPGRQQSLERFVHESSAWERTIRSHTSHSDRAHESVAHGVPTVQDPAPPCQGRLHGGEHTPQHTALSPVEKHATAATSDGKRRGRGPGRRRHHTLLGAHAPETLVQQQTSIGSFSRLLSALGRRARGSKKSWACRWGHARADAQTD